MRNRNGHALSALVTLAVFVFCSTVVFAQNRQQGGAAQGRNTPAADKVPSLPAPVHDINGVWAGAAVGRNLPPPPMTPEGQALFKANKPFFGPALVPVAESNDPMITCDPLGFPRNVVFEIRGVKFVQIPSETLQLMQYQRIWREIWTDGRALPTGVGSDRPDAPDPRYYGYSIGPGKAMPRLW